MKRIVALTLALALAPFANADDHVNDCDRYAAHPSDPDKVVDGVGSGDVKLAAAIRACRAAVAEFPDNARFHYQLGRVLVYWATANGADPSEGAALVEKSADMGHTQAQFVQGLLLRQDPANACSVERYTRLAADKGLKSARLTYANDFVAGFYDDCKAAASKDVVRGYLDAAASQLAGYYEGMLHGALLRQLESA